MALATKTEELYGNRVEVEVSGLTAEYGKGFGSKAAALARELAKKQGATRVKRRSHGVSWDGENFSEHFMYLILG